MKMITSLNKETKIFFGILGAGLFFSVLLMTVESQHDIIRFTGYQVLCGIVGALAGFLYLYNTGRLTIYQGEKHKPKDHFLSRKVASEIKMYPLILISISLVLIIPPFMRENLPSGEPLMWLLSILFVLIGASLTFNYFIGSGWLNIYKEEEQ